MASNAPLRRLASLALGVALLGVPAFARAQSCHRVVMPEGVAQDAHPPHRLELGVGVLGAAIDGGDYQGALLGAVWQRDWASLALSLPLYRLHQGSTRVIGPGDLAVQGQARVLGDARFGAGILAGAGLPTGNATDRLGMGHVMAMGGLFGNAPLAALDLLASVTLAGALLSDESQHSHAHAHVLGGPLVNPMNRLEVGGALQASLALADALDVYALGLLAVPIVKRGTSRVEAGPGARLALGAWSLDAELQFGLLGHPFQVRALAGAAYAFELP